jgi:FtsZ-binding cell division protein ZapB
VEELLVKLEAKVKQALERIEELESENARLREENDSLTETQERLREELEQKQGEVAVIAELRARLEASEAKQELARRRIEAIIAELDEILTQEGESSPEPAEAEADPPGEEERTLPPGAAFPFETETPVDSGEEEPPDSGEEEPGEPSDDTFPLLDFDEGGEPPAGESGGFTESGGEPVSDPPETDDPTAEEESDKDPFGGPI